MEKLKQPFFRKVFFFYTIAAVLSLLVMLIPMSWQAYSSDQQQIENERLDKIQALVRTLDEQFSNMEKISIQLTNTSWVTKLSSNSEVLSSQIDYLKQRDICREMSRYHGLVRPARSTALLLPQKGTAVDRVSIWETDDYFSSIGVDETDFLPDFLEYVSEAPNSLGMYQTPAYPDGFFVFKQLDYNDSPKQILLFAVDAKQLQYLISKNSAEPVPFWEISPHGGVIYEYGQQQTGRELFTVTCDSDTYPWSYTFQVEFSGGHISSGNLLLAITALLAFTAGIILAYFLASITSRPLYTLLQHMGLQPSKDSPEFTAIETAFSDLNNEKDSLEASSQKYWNMIRANLLSTLVRGAFEPETMEADLAAFHLPFRDSMWFMLLWAGYQAPADRSSMALDILKIQEYLEKEKIQCVEILKETSHSIVIILGEQGDSEQLLERSNAIREFLKENFSSNMTTYGIPPQRGLVSISRMYREVKFYARKKSALLSHSYYPIHLEIQLISLLRLGNGQGAQELLLKLRQKNEELNLPAEEMRGCMRDIANTMLRVALEMNIDAEAVESEFLQEILGVQDMEWAWDYLKNFAALICRRSSSQSDEGTRDVGGRMLAYVQEHYCDSSLSQQELADQFQLSRSAVSKIFKSAAQVNFIDYLHLLRVQKAKEYFDAGATNILEIAKKTGYENEITFKRAFQRVETVTPKKYIDAARDYFR